MSAPAPRKVLIIDDDRLQFRIVQAYFKQFRNEQFILEWSETYEDGLAKLLAGGYSACLLDYMLGPRDGLELIREAMEQGNRIPIVFLTAESDESVDISAMNSGASDYLLKGDITPRTLERSMRYAMKLGETMEALRHLAIRDQLTGLLNRREFDRILREESERALRFGRSFALVMVDIDHFKTINDEHGHPAGDEVLRQVAAVLEVELRSVDRVARFGGEEFAIILMEVDRAAALETAKRLCAAMAREPRTINNGLDLKVTISAGAAAVPQDGKTPAELVAAADRALYAAKKSGRNRAVAAG